MVKEMLYVFSSSEKGVENKEREASGERKVLLMLMMKSISRYRQAMVSSLNSESVRPINHLAKDPPFRKNRLSPARLPTSPDKRQTEPLLL